MKTILPMWFVLMSSPALAGWPDHEQTASAWVVEVDASNNEYGTPSAVTYDAAGLLHVYAECGGFVDELLKHTYAGINSTVLTHLSRTPTFAGSGAPNAAQWADILLNQRAADGFSAFRRSTVATIARGDILASAYTSAGGTGHVMVVSSITRLATNQPSTIPNVSRVDKYQVRVFDATRTVHRDQAGTTDTRYRTDIDPATGLAANDRGAGSGDILLYANTRTGALVGWTWATNQTVPYQGTSSTAANYRPMVAGYLRGPGL